MKEHNTLTNVMKGALLSVVLLFSSCEHTGGVTGDTWDRSAMLAHQTEHFILPAYASYNAAANDLHTATKAFNAEMTEDRLETLREALDEVYLALQWVSFLEVGPSESLALRYRSNTYPADTAAIRATALGFDGTNAPSFELPSTYDQQGLPALDFIVHSLALEDFLGTPSWAAYMDVLAEELAKIATAANDQWTATAATFMADAGTSAGASTNKLANDFIYHMEKELRAGKVGIPAGVFSAATFPGKVESVYGARSKQLFLESLKAHQMFFTGVAFDSLSVGPSFAGYLDHLDIKDGTTMLSDKITASFKQARSLAHPLDEDFAQQITDDSLKMLELFDALQRGVILMKVDMMQAMNIKVDYVDADGD